MQGGEKGNLCLGSVIGGKSRVECGASEGEVGGWDSRMLGLPLCKSLLFRRSGTGFCSTRHKVPSNNCNCSHQIGKIGHFRSIILFLIKLLAT